MPLGRIDLPWKSIIFLLLLYVYFYLLFLFLSFFVTITASAKEQITSLTDEIAQKFEDNVQQQEEITQLINMVVELQKKQKQVSILNL